jgi:hypothetical protein
MLAALPTHPSPRLDPFVPLLSSLFSVTSATSALKSPRSPIAEFNPLVQSPNHFPLFPHPVNIAHAQTPINPSPSIVYFTTSSHPGGGASEHSRARRFRSMPCPTPAPAPSITPLNATLTKKQGLPYACLAPPILATHYSPPTTHFPHQSATLSLRGTHDPR